MWSSEMRNSTGVPNYALAYPRKQVIFVYALSENLQLTQNHLSLYLDCLILEDGTDMVSQNVGNQPSTHTV